MGDGLSVSIDVTAVPAQPVGVGRMALSLAPELAAREDLEVSLITRRDDTARWRLLAPEARVAGGAPRQRALRLGWEQLALPRLLSSLGVDVHHGIHYTMPERARIPCVVTIHDLSFLEHPEWHERSKVHFFRRAISVASRKATALICVSEHTAERLSSLCSPRGRVFTIPHGVDHHRFFPYSTGSSAGPDPLARHDESLVTSLGAREPYVLFVGTLEPRKAVPDLVEAFDAVADAEPGLSLVLAGRPGWGVGEIERKLATARHRERIVLTGYVPEEALPALLRRAAVVAYPATEEGFGLPALEALACGVPLVTTKGTAMSELAGEAAITFSAGDDQELARALELALGEKTIERRRVGLEIASRYTWRASAEAHAEAYRWAANAA